LIELATYELIIREVKLQMTITNISHTLSTYGFDTTHILIAASGLAQFVIELNYYQISHSHMV